MQSTYGFITATELKLYRWHARTVAAVACLRRVILTCTCSAVRYISYSHA